MTRSEAIEKWIMPACKKVWNEKRCNEILKALEYCDPCDLCEYAPASSGDGKPCTMCPATRSMTVVESVDESRGSVVERVDDCISRQAALDACDQSINIIEARDRIEELRSVQPERKTGRWIGIDDEPHEDYECSNCGYVCSTFSANIEPHTEFKFCPNCGARMEVQDADSN